MPGDGVHNPSGPWKLSASIEIGEHNTCAGASSGGASAGTASCELQPHIATMTAAILIPPSYADYMQACAPPSQPFLRLATRCADEPCVNFSGWTVPCALFCKVSSPI